MSERRSSWRYWLRFLILGTIVGLLHFAVYMGIAVIG